MTDKDMEAAYNRLAMLHTETMAELVATRQRLDNMSSLWWPLFKQWVKAKLGIANRYE